MQNLSLRQLRSLLAIQREGKIINAANSLGLTGPAVTLQLKQVEEELGMPLFDRTRDGLRPTVAGEAALVAAHEIEARLRMLSDELEALAGASAGRLTIGAVSTAKYFVPSLMAAFRAEHPGMRMELKIGNRQATIAMLRDYEADITLMGRPPRGFEVHARIFGDHPLVIIAPPDHPMANKRDIDKHRLANEDFIVREQGSGTRSSLDIFMRDVRGWDEQTHSEMDSNETIKQAVMAGLGIAFISAHTVASEVQAKKLAILDVKGMPIRRQWYAVARTDRSHSPAMTAFLSFLSRRGAEFLPTIPMIYPDTYPG